MGRRGQRYGSEDLGSPLAHPAVQTGPGLVLTAVQVAPGVLLSVVVWRQLSRTCRTRPAHTLRGMLRGSPIGV